MHTKETTQETLTLTGIMEVRIHIFETMKDFLHRKVLYTSPHPVIHPNQSVHLQHNGATSIHLVTFSLSQIIGTGVTVKFAPLQIVFIFFDTATYDEIKRDVKVTYYLKESLQINE